MKSLQIIYRTSNLSFAVQNEERHDDVAGVETDEVYVTKEGIFYVTIDEDGLRTLHEVGMYGRNQFPRMACRIEEGMNDFLVFPRWEIPVRQFAIDLGITTTSVR